MNIASRQLFILEQLAEQRIIPGNAASCFPQPPGAWVCWILHFWSPTLYPPTSSPDSCSMPPPQVDHPPVVVKKKKEQYNCQSANPVVELKQNDRQKQYDYQVYFRLRQIWQDPSFKMLFHDILLPSVRDAKLVSISYSQVKKLIHNAQQCQEKSKKRICKDQQKPTKNGGYASCLQEIPQYRHAHY